MSILNKYKKFKYLLLTIRDRYYDFVLTQDSTLDSGIETKVTDDLVTKGLSGYINFTLNECVSGNTFVSLDNYKWDKAVNDGAELLDIGLTGIDNGLIKLGYDITDEEYYDILKNSKIIFESGDTKMHVFPVSGNTGKYQYGYTYKTNNYITMTGGFLQGVFKLEKFPYQILPQFIDNSLHVEFTLRPNAYYTPGRTLNDEHPENKGIFFYMGARAENKFAILNGADVSMYPLRDDDDSPFLPDREFLSGITITDSENNEIDNSPKKEIKTDNKYLFFNRSKDGFTVDTWDENTDVILEAEATEANENLYLLMNRTCSGYTVDTIEKYRKTVATKSYYTNYNVAKDAMNNSFALKINDDFSIGYRYLVKDCDSESGWSIKEERTFPNIIKDDEWSTIHVRFQILNGGLDECGYPTSVRKMKIYIYVNGYLKLVSKELDEFNFTALNETYTKQEMVPFSISIGGGTQGLCDMVWPGYEKQFNRILPIEQNFAGTFVGDITSFKIYSEPLDYNEIKSNHLYEKKIIRIKNI